MRNQWYSKWFSLKCMDRAILYLLLIINKDTLLEYATFANYQGIMLEIVLHRDPFSQTPSDLPWGDVEEEELLEMVLQEEDNHFPLEGEEEEEEEIELLNLLNGMKFVMQT